MGCRAVVPGVCSDTGDTAGLGNSLAGSQVIHNLKISIVVVNIDNLACRGQATRLQASLLPALTLLCFQLLVPLSVAGIKVGNLVLEPSAKLGLRYDTNVNSSEAAPLEDTLLELEVRWTGNWDLTEYNTFNFEFGATYRKYLQNEELDRELLNFSLIPDTHLDLGIRISEYLSLLLADDLRFADDTTDTIGFDGQGNVLRFDTLQYSRIENEFSARLLWDVSQNDKAFAYFRRDDIVTYEDEFDYVDRSTHALGVDWKHILGEAALVGVTGEMTWSDHAEAVRNDSSGYSAAVYANYGLTEFISLEGRYGYQHEDFEEGGAIDDSSDVSSPYWSIGLNHTVNSSLSHAISYAQSTRLGFLANSVDYDTLSWAVAYNGLRNTVVNAVASREWAEDSGGVYPEEFERWLLQVSAVHTLSPRMNIELAFSYQEKDSNRILRSYDRMQVSVFLARRF